MTRSKTIRPDAACNSADVLTPVETAVSRLQSSAWADPTEIVFRAGTMKWGDVPSIREKLTKLLGGMTCISGG